MSERASKRASIAVLVREPILMNVRVCFKRKNLTIPEQERPFFSMFRDAALLDECTRVSLLAFAYRFSLSGRASLRLSWSS